MSTSPTSNNQRYHKNNTHTKPAKQNICLAYMSGFPLVSHFYRHRAQSSESIGRVTMCVACLQCGVRWSPALSGSSFKMRIDFERD